MDPDTSPRSYMHFESSSKGLASYLVVESTTQAVYDSTWLCSELRSRLGAFSVVQLSWESESLLFG
jgi:hypothetical protein